MTDKEALAASRTRNMLVKRGFAWPFGGRDLALCDSAGIPLPRQRSLQFTPFEGFGDRGLLTVVFVVDGRDVRFDDD